MNLLLDTHVLLWALTDDERLSDKARTLLEMTTNDIFYSTVSLWEIELKQQSKPHSINNNATDIAKYCEQAGYKCLQLKSNHISHLDDVNDEIAGSLKHKDPFDRMLLAQSISENLLFLTHDEKLIYYKNPFVLLI